MKIQLLESSDLIIEIDPALTLKIALKYIEGKLTILLVTAFILNFTNHTNVSSRLST